MTETINTAYEPRRPGRFAFTASTVGVGAALTSPNLAESWAPACLPIIGGHSASALGLTIWPSIDDPVLQFDRAETEITGRQTGWNNGAEEFETVIRKTVANLNILNRLIASIGVEITFHYTRRPTPEIDAQRDLVDVRIALFHPFMIDTPGVSPIPPLQQPIYLNPNIPAHAGRDFKQFRKEVDLLRPGRAHHKHEIGENGLGGHGQGLIYTALAEPVHEFTYDDPDFGRLDVPGLGKVYVGEWWGQPYWQSLTFLRVEFEDTHDRVNPKSKFSGQIIIDDCDDGTTYP